MSKKRIYTKETLEKLCPESKSISDLMRRLGLEKYHSGTARLIRSRIVEYGIKAPHLLNSPMGKGWAKGKLSSSDPRIRTRRIPDEKFFVIKSSTISGTVIRRRLIEIGRNYSCAECNLGPVWNGKALTLHVDHINGICNDNRLENLRFLCPNCHQQTSTWGGKNRGYI